MAAEGRVLNAEQQLRDMHRALAQDTALTDDAVRSVVAAWANSLQTSCNGAGDALFAAIAPVCLFRPHLTHEMLLRALPPLVSMGYRHAVQVAEWSQDYLWDTSPYVAPDPSARHWLAEVLPAQLDTVQSALDHLVLKADIELLEHTDDPEHVECPPDFQWSALQARVVVLQSKLERIGGRKFVLCDGVQDASFFADLSIQRLGHKYTETVFAVRFSNFGNLFTTWSQCETERLPEAMTAELVAAVEREGFVFVSLAALDEPYSGRHPGFIGTTWWFRFFDYS